MVWKTTCKSAASISHIEMAKTSLPSDEFIAVDWGTTNRRVFIIRNGEVAQVERDNKGVKSPARGDYEHELSALRERFGDLPILLAGMVGANVGFRDAGYVSAPGSLRDLAKGRLEVGDRIWIIPGFSYLGEDRCDIMRGEEVQFLGAVAAGLVSSDATLCQPGTHAKWARIENGQLTSFATAMTGEVFSLLRNHSLLAAQIAGDVHVGPAFVDGVREARTGDLLGSLFGIRAASVLGRRSDRDAASFASGLLIGSECVAHAGNGPVTLISDQVMGGLYHNALAELGIECSLIDSEKSFLAGIMRIWADCA